MNFVDLVIVLLIVMTVVRGAEIGLVRQIGSLVGVVVGLFAGSLLASLTHAGAVVSLLMIALAVVAAVAAGEYASIHLRQALHKIKLSKVDGIFGAVIGGAVCLIIIWLSAALISIFPSTGLQQSVRDSRVIAWLDDTLPPATSVMQWLETSLAQTKLPDIVRELEPTLPNTEARLPNIGAFNSVVEEARASVVEIEGRSCSGIGVGSGFVAGDGIVITNAHVVAGMRNPYIQDANGRHRSQVIGFDPDLDIAVLRTDGLAGAPLPMLDDTVPLTTPGVVLGYPGGGPFTARPGVVIERFIALGKDIYSETSGKRDVYALKANIQEGNSGGPILDKDGRVYGVVFARSTSYHDVGYALTTPAVLDALATALRSPAAGTSARCLAE